MKRQAIFWSLVWLCLVTQNITLAGVISLTQTATANIDDGVLTVDLDISNVGDSAAFNVQARIIFPGTTENLSMLKTLPAGNVYQQSAKINLGGDTDGEFHILSLVVYDDNKNQRHTNTAEMYLNTVPITARPINIHLNTESSDNYENRSRLILENKLNESVELDVQLITPETVAINQETRHLTLNGGEKYSLPIILNSSGFKEVGSSPLFVIARYPNKDIQYSHLLSVSSQEIEGNRLLKSFFTSNDLLMWIVIVLLLILFFTLSLNIIKRKKE